MRNSGDRKWLLWFAIAVMLATTIPYLIGFQVQGDAWRFTGFVFGVDDGNSYIAKMLRGASGDWLFRTPYTTYPQRGVFAFLPYLLIGKLTSPPAQHLQLVVLYHLFRMIAGLLSIWATYDFLSLWMTESRLRRFGVALAVLGGGLGWILVGSGHDQWLGSLPLEFYSPESFGFLSIFGIPHLAAARGFFLWALVFYLRPQRQSESALETKGSFLRWLVTWNQGARQGMWIGLLLLAVGMMQPLTVAIAWYLLLAHLAFMLVRSLIIHWNESPDWKPDIWIHFKRAFWGIGISSPIVLNIVWTSLSDPFFKNWTAQNLISSPHPLHYLVAYGVLLPFGFIGLARIMRIDKTKGLFALMWLVSLPFLAYTPFNLQRRLPEGIFVMLVALALIPFDSRGNESSGINGENSLKLIKQLGWSFLLFPSTLFLLVGASLAVKSPGPPLYLPIEQARAFEFLDRREEQDAVVLASFETGNALPAWTPMKVLIGHGPESVGLASLRPEVESFYQSATGDKKRVAFLEAFNVDYVFWGMAERKLGDWDPHQAGYLMEIYTSPMVSIFRPFLHSNAQSAGQIP